MVYREFLDLGSHKECDVYILASDGKVTASLLFYYNGKCSHHIVIRKDTDADVVKVSHKGKRFPEYVMRVVNYPHLTPLVFEVGACNSSS